MLKSIAKQSWICPRCLLQQQQRWQQRLRRSLTTAAVATESESIKGFNTLEKFPLLASHSTPGKEHDDRTLRSIFDSQPLWQAFSQRSLTNGLERSTGLFQNRYLKHRKGFERFAQVTLQKAKKLVSTIFDISTVEGYRGLPRDLDRLSDLLCRVIDLCDFVRSTHPALGVQEAAASAHAMMFEYMNVLNTTTRLYDQLKKAFDIPEVVQSWTEEELITAQILMRDFNKSAIELPLEGRQKFVDLSNEINSLGSEFVDKMAPEKPYLYFPKGSFKGMDPVMAQQLIRWGKIVLPTSGPLTAMALRTVEDENIRREIYVASRSFGPEHIDRLEKLLRQRAELASLSRYESYAQMALGDKMAKSPESVGRFLQALLRKNKGGAQTEYAKLGRRKQIHELKRGMTTQLNAWDRDYYIYQQILQARRAVRHPDSLSAYFSLGTVMQGLSRLFSRLYRLRLVPRQTGNGETWNDEVRRLDVIDDQEGHIAVIYCDLFERMSKNPNPAHFTLRCSRRISSEELHDEFSEGYDSETDMFETAEEAATDGMASSRTAQGELYQLPTIALICNFSRASNDEPTLLSFSEVETLFHEMGHAMHSVLGRTAMQNVSGTRCPTDFAELPSVLMEYFASAPEVLALFARHWRTDAPLPYQMVQDKLALDSRFEASEIETQIILAMLDQQYHSSAPLDSPDFNTTRIYHAITNQWATVREPAETSWQGFFGHLFGYGAVYYSYLFDRAIAGKVWKDVFQSTAHGGGAVSPEAGSRFRQEVLRWGGSRDGWRCVAGVLRDESLAEGGETAMAKVGEWGVHG